jgi:predicted permease
MEIDRALKSIDTVRRMMRNVLRARENARAVGIAAWLDGLWQDLRHAVHSLRRSPGLVAVSALSLGLGLGLNAFLYMGVRTIYGHRPTMVEPDRMVGVEPGNANQFSYPDYQDLRRSRIFDEAVGFRAVGLNLGSGALVRRVGALAVTANFFDVLGIGADAGRTFSAVEAAPEREPRVVVVTAAFWRSALRADPAAIGESLVLNGEPFTVIGVLSEEYRAVTGWMGPPLYVPLSTLTLPAIDERGSPSLSVLARLAPGGTAQEADAAVTALGAALERTYPDRITREGRPASVFPATAMQFRGSQGGFRLLATVAWVTAGLVLLIACINVMGLLIARAAHRRREIAIRVAVGAGRARVVQAMLVESFVLVAAGAALAVPLAFAAVRMPILASMPPLQSAVTPDTRLLPFGSVLIVATTLICGLIPALRATRTDVVSGIRQSGEGGTLRVRLHQTLVVGQVAMSLVLIVAALLCVRSQILIGRTDVGFDLDHGIVATFGLAPNQYQGEARSRFAERLVERVAHIPGVTSASVADLVPLGGDSLIRSFHPAGRTDIPGTRPSIYSVGPGYFRTLAIPFRQGRDFDAADRSGTPPVAIVNETFARTYFPGQQVIGRSVQTADEPEAEVVGVVRDSRIGTIGEAPQSVIYYAYPQRPRRLVLHVRTVSSPDALVTTVEQAIDEIDAAVPVGVQTLRSATSLELTMRRLGTVLMGTLGGVALLLALVGLYGVMSYLAASRTGEIGIRMALGASRPRIQREVLQRALRVVAKGVMVGAILSIGLMPFFSTFLAGISPFDPVAFGGAAAILILVGAAAGYIPARRSAGLDPARALRQT